MFFHLLDYYDITTTKYFYILLYKLFSVEHRLSCRGLWILPWSSSTLDSSSNLQCLLGLWEAQELILLTKNLPFLRVKKNNLAFAQMYVFLGHYKYSSWISWNPATVCSHRGQMCWPQETANEWKRHSCIETSNKSHMALGLHSIPNMLHLNYTFSFTNT